MFALKKYNQAAVAARQILELSHAPNSETRRTAWKIIARAEFEKGDYTRAEVAYKVALSLTGINDTSRKALKDGLAASVYKQGEYMKSKGNLQGAIAQFSRVEQVSPNSAVIQSAEFDIAASLLESGSWGGAISKFLAFRDKNPAHPLSARVSENLVKAYLKSKQPLKAAVELENMAKNASNPEIGRAALWQAAELYEEADSEQQIITTYKRYVSTFPQPVEQATEARHKLAAIYGKRGQLGERRHWLNEIIQSDKNAGNGSTPRTQYLAAKAAFELAEPALQSFQQVKLVRPLKQNLARKKQKMKEAVDAFTLAADYGIAEVTTASVYWLAEIYNEFGRELMQSERPEGLSEEEVEQYDILLEEQAYPFEEKSINIHESNVGRVSEGTFDEWIKKSFEELRKLSPIRYAKSEKSESTALYLY
jgi:outer membrane protein assembly factor BamD (BamD/ComL family)